MSALPDLTALALTGNRRALAQVMTVLETGGEAGRAVMRAVSPHAGNAHIIGVTGPPGAGKSTLIDALTVACRQQDQMVGIVCVDPTSPFTGGALLGDRVRMQERATEEGVFIRSMAARGHPGGVARATRRVATLLDAAGFDVVLIETVGSGQAEWEIRYTAQTICLVTAPHSGDAVQALKAGLLEAAHVIVVNKADLPSADETVAVLEGVLTLSGQNPEQTWTVPVLKTTAERSEGVAELRATLAQHCASLKTSGQWEKWREQSVRRAIVTAAQDLLWARLSAQWDDALAAHVRAVLDGQYDPDTAAERLMEQWV